MDNLLDAQPAANVLYLSYDGMTDPLGPSQVLAYLVELVKTGHRITLISFEKPERSAAEILAVRTFCRAAGIDWHPLTYTKRPPVIAKLRDLRAMWRLVNRLSKPRAFDIVHCRSYMPALVGARYKRLTGAKLIFDMRGFWADERVEGGLWSTSHPVYGAIYRWMKKQEKSLLDASDHTVVLTERARGIMLDDWHVGADKPITVIPCCADLQAFPRSLPTQRAQARRELDIAESAKVAVYLGSIGTWYMLGEMLDCFAVQRRADPSAVMLFVTRDAPGPILAAARARGIPASAIRIQSAGRSEVPRYLAAADYGLFFIRPTFSKQASSPVKLGELLAVGLPVVTNAGVGDVDHIVRETGAGVLVEAFDQTAYGEAIAAIDGLTVSDERRREGLERWFDLSMGVARYDRIYRALAA